MKQITDYRRRLTIVGSLALFVITILFISAAVSKAQPLVKDQVVMNGSSNDCPFKAGDDQLNNQESFK